jgi:hypothetical protein
MLQHISLDVSRGYIADLLSLGTRCRGIGSVCGLYQFAENEIMIGIFAGCYMFVASVGMIHDNKHPAFVLEIHADCLCSFSRRKSPCMAEVTKGENICINKRRSEG